MTRLLLAAALVLTACHKHDAAPPAPADRTAAVSPTPAAPLWPPALWPKPGPDWSQSCDPSSPPTDCTSADGPVCAQRPDLTRATYPGKCDACSDPKVLFYHRNPCPSEPPAAP